MYTHIDPDDEDAVVWLQRTISRLTGYPTLVYIGKFDSMTKKALRFYQYRRHLPVTGEPDEATLQQINEELAER